MIPLIKIRATYLKRNIKQFILGHLFLPILIFIGLSIYLSKNGPEPEIQMREKQVFNYGNYSEYYLFKDTNFSIIFPYISNTSLVVNDNEIGNKLVQYIKEELNVTLNLYSNENELNNHSQNIILLNYNKDKNTFKFTFKQKEIVGITEKTYLPFNSTNLSTISASDIFTYGYNKYYNITKKSNKIFITFQAFLSKFLIEKIDNKIINKDIHFNFGLNSYPESVKNARDYSNIEILLDYLISFQFIMEAMALSTQMIVEKEQKLDNFLNRQGINQFKYILSWFINYIIITLFPMIVSIIIGLLFLKCLKALYLLNLILYSLALFSMVLFCLTINKDKKYGVMIVNLLLFGSMIFGFILVMGSPHIIIQILFNFFPNANIFSANKLIIKLQFLGKYSSDNMLLKYNGINFLTTIIMFVVEIIFYLFLSIFIILYKNSGLTFFNFIKSIFCKVDRKTNKFIIQKEELDEEIFHEELNEKNKLLKKQNMYLNIINITRKYDQLIAVNNFNGELFKNEIFCLLGHNGAGKTTLIKMISGTEDPDNGDIFLNNISIVTNKNYLFRNIGLCQQENIFF